MGITTLCGEGMNQINNGSFEEPGPGETARDWIPVYGGYRVASNVARTGDKSLRIVPAEDTGRGGALQRISGFKPGARLHFVARIYIASFDSGIIKPIHIAFRSHDETRYQHTNLVYGEGGEKQPLGQWLEFAKTLDLAEYPDVEAIAVYCITWNLGDKPFAGEVYFDDISVTEL